MTTPILAGAEPFSAGGGPIGVVVLHGFTGSPQSMRPLAQALAAAGFSVELPLLPGHGTSVGDMVPTRWSDWSSVAEAAYGDLAGRSDRVFVAGLSMAARWRSGLPSGTPTSPASSRSTRWSTPHLRASGTCCRECSKKAPFLFPRSVPTSRCKAPPNLPMTPRRSNQCSRCSTA